MNSTYLLACLLFGATSCASNNVAVQQESANRISEPIWCELSYPEPETPNDWKEIEKSNIHLVRTDMQERAQSRLKENRLLKISRKDAMGLIRDTDFLSTQKYSYLIGMAALNIDLNYEIQLDGRGQIPIHATFSPSRKKLAISSYAFGLPSPMNVAVIVQSDEEILFLDSRCLRAL